VQTKQNRLFFNDILCIYVIAAYPLQLVFFYEQISWNLWILNTDIIYNKNATKYDSNMGF